MPLTYLDSELEYTEPTVVPATKTHSISYYDYHQNEPILRFSAENPSKAEVEATVQVYFTLNIKDISKMAVGIVPQGVEPNFSQDIILQLEQKDNSFSVDYGTQHKPYEFTMPDRDVTVALFEWYGNFTD